MRCVECIVSADIRVYACQQAAEAVAEGELALACIILHQIKVAANETGADLDALIALGDKNAARDLVDIVFVFERNEVAAVSEIGAVGHRDIG